MKRTGALIKESGVTLIELIIAALIGSIIATITISSYSSYRLRAERVSGEVCLAELARLQESYFSRNNTYSTDLKALGYNAAEAASCAHTQQYLLSASLVDATTCPLNRCYRLVAIPQETQTADGALYLTYDSSQTDPSLRMKKERGTLGSGEPWDK